MRTTMFFTRTLSFIAISGLLLFSACCKNDTTYQQQTNVEDIHSHSSKFVNFFASVDSIGQLHNELLLTTGNVLHDQLDYYATHGFANNNEKTQFITTIKNVMKSELSSGHIGNIVVPSTIADYLIETAGSSMTDSILTTNFMVSGVQSKLNSALASIGSPSSLPALKTAIQNTSASILSSSNTVADTQVVVYLYSVYYSLCFWTDAYTNINNPWYHFVHSIPHPIYTMHGNKGWLSNAWKSLVNFVKTIVSGLSDMADDVNDFIEENGDVIASDALGAALSFTFIDHTVIGMAVVGASFSAFTVISKVF